MIGREFLSPEDRNLAGPDIGRADEDLDIGAGAHAIKVDERVDRVPQRIDVERVGLVWTEASGDHVHPGLVVPEAQHQVEESALGRGTGRADARRAPEGFEPAARPVDPAFQPACTNTTAFMAPALAPVIASTPRRPSSRRASSTRHVRAPCPPPPCRASDTVFWLCARRGRRFRADFVESDPSSRCSRGNFGDEPCPGHVSLLKGGGAGDRVNLTDRHAAATSHARTVGTATVHR